MDTNIKMKNPTVSVVIATHNYARFLPEALQSVLSQTYTDWECIIVDDASTDNTEEIAREWMAKDIRFRYIKNERNLGEAGTRNVGNATARGEYIAVLDADDWWELDKLELQMQAFADNSNALICYAGAIVHENDTKRIWNIETHIKDEFDYALRVGDQCPHGSVIVKKQTLAEVGGYDVSLPPAADWDLWLRVMFRFGAESFSGIDKPLLHYRIHGNNISGNPLKLCRAERIVMIRSLLHKGYLFRYPFKAKMILDAQLDREINNYRKHMLFHKAYRIAIYSALLSPIRRWKWQRALALRRQHV